MKSFYDKYQDYTKKQLFDILFHRDDYQQEAVEAATYFLRKNKWDAEFEKLLEKQQQAYETEITEKAEYYSKEVEFRKDNNYYLIRPGEAQAFEDRLNIANIRYFKMDNDVDLFKVPYPAVVYYFKNQDIEAVDKICVELNLETTFNVDQNPFLKMEVKVMIIAAILLALVGIVSLLTRS